MMKLNLRTYLPTCLAAALLQGCAIAPEVERTQELVGQTTAQLRATLLVYGREQGEEFEARIARLTRQSEFLDARRNYIERAIARWRGTADKATTAYFEQAARSAKHSIQQVVDTPARLESYRASLAVQQKAPNQSAAVLKDIDKKLASLSKPASFKDFAPYFKLLAENAQKLAAR